MNVMTLCIMTEEYQFIDKLCIGFENIHIQL